MRHLLLSINCPEVESLRESPTTLDDILTEVGGPDLVKSLDGGTQSTVHTEDLAVDDGGQGEVVEDLCAVPPHLHHS